MDLFAEIAVFTQVVDLRGFTRAAANLRLTPSGVSRIVTRLEARLGARLLNRTTRSLSLTDDGAEYYQRCTRILAELDDANATLAKANATPRGRLRVDVPIVLADFVVGPALPRFLERYREVLPSREVLNNLGLAHYQLAARALADCDGRLVGRYRLPLVVDPRTVEDRSRLRGSDSS